MAPPTSCVEAVAMCSQEVSNFLDLPPHLPVSLWMLTRQEAYSHILQNEGGMPDEMNWGPLSDTILRKPKVVKRSKVWKTF